ncbi:Lpg1974 family pore-forming outer membrane protein [Thalassoroseus pseudoceratinae]|uniref:Lpg1974 family pore-forming outer membrane protein n=1 Tax=Thalassoroseus pseudoceratinae TaxID=2713176 RepID=UPI001420DE04|nr:Lpg1974 family pore-forming outer membrane protein [Thalassoroseus pseudoceratinae]
MNASILCLMGLLTAPPAGDAPQTTSHADTQVVTVFRGQSPGFQAPIVIQGDGTTPTFQSGPVLSAPETFGPPATSGPVLAEPNFGGPSFGGPALPPSTVIQPSVDPFLPGPPPPGSPLAGNGLVFGGYYFGYEAVIVKPYFSSNSAVNAEAIGNPRDDRLIDFDWSLEYSTRYTLGYSGSDGFGGRVRYWEFGEDADESAVASPNQLLTNQYVNRGALVTAGPGQRYVARQNLGLDVFDVEGTFHRDNARHAFTASVGVRFAELDEDLTTAAFTAAGAPISSSIRDYNFRGVGPTVSLLGRKRLWTTNWAIFASGRFSLLYGESQENSTGQDVIGAYSFRHNSYDRIVPVVELQTGVEWSQPCECFGGSTFFARAGLEGQSWIDSLPNGDLGFLGATFGAGWAF